METDLYEICMEHSLTGLSISVVGLPDTPYIGVFVHWCDKHIRGCAGGNAPTFEEAFSLALAEMSERKRAAA